ncbi:MAG: hypothetical protein QM655_15365 [Nocardioidaceae bacterium]
MALFYWIGLAVASIGIVDFPRSRRTGYRWIWAVLGILTSSWFPVLVGIQLFSAPLDEALALQARVLVVTVVVVIVSQGCAFYPVSERTPAESKLARWQQAWCLEPALKYLRDGSTRKKIARLERARDLLDGDSMISGESVGSEVVTSGSPSPTLSPKVRYVGALTLVVVAMALGRRRDSRKAVGVERLGQ